METKPTTDTADTPEQDKSWYDLAKVQMKASHVIGAWLAARAGHKWEHLTPNSRQAYAFDGQRLLGSLLNEGLKVVEKNMAELYAREGHKNMVLQEQHAAALAAAQHDDPDADATDAAHPAWWRGNDQGSRSTAQALAHIAEAGEQRGKFGGPKVQEAADRILRALDRARQEGIEEATRWLDDHDPCLADHVRLLAKEKK